MEIVLFIVIAAVVAFLVSRSRQEDRQRHTPVDVKPKPAVSTPVALSKKNTISGKAFVIDGDSLVINKTEIRLFGVDAPEFNHPYGNKAKWALLRLCQGHRIRAEVDHIDAHGRTVARCYLPCGSDISELMVKQGLAIDWPKYSGGIYRRFEVPDARRKMWLADARQKGRMNVWKQYEARHHAK